jgi:hypothetical protein
VNNLTPGTVHGPKFIGSCLEYPELLSTPPVFDDMGDILASVLLGGPGERFNCAVVRLYLDGATDMLRHCKESFEHCWDQITNLDKVPGIVTGNPGVQILDCAVVGLGVRCPVGKTAALALVLEGSRPRDIIQVKSSLVDSLIGFLGQLEI